MTVRQYVFPGPIRFVTTSMESTNWNIHRIIQLACGENKTDLVAVDLMEQHDLFLHLKTVAVGK